MFENILNFFKRLGKSGNNKESNGSKNKAKDRLHLVLMQDRANVSADFLELMKQEIIEVIKKYIEVEESEIDVRLTNEIKEDGTTGAPSLYANIPIVNIRNDMKKEVEEEKKEDKEESKQEIKEESNEEKEEVVDQVEDQEENQQEIQEESKQETEVEKEDKEESNLSEN